ncbi:MAG: lactonase family protein [Gammaproteobacteria bacterium]|nr:lactonase family protein [Gammaproteobacteria bacterium]MBU1480511.1 lactonase family protein [Gammaproteobacteria bacterium]
MANSGDNAISIYSVDAASGQLRHSGYVLAGAAPQSVTVDPFGKFAYVANNGASSVSGYSIDAGSLAVDPAGKFAYVANINSGNVSAYIIDAVTGTLTTVGIELAGTAPVSIATTGTVQ